MITRAALLAAALRLLGYYNGNDYSADNPGGMSGVGGMATNWEPCIQDIGAVANGVGEVAGTIAAAQSTIAMVWDAATTAADPGAGKLRATTAAPAVGSYSLLVSATDSTGADISAMLSELGSSSSATKARARLVAVGDASKHLDLQVTGVSGAGAYRTIAVTCIGGPGGIADGDAVALGWVRSGDKGDTGAVGPAGGPVYYSAVTAGSPNAQTLAGPLASLAGNPSVEFIAGLSNGAVTRVNLAPWSEAFDQWSAFGGAVVTANTSVGPWGRMVADTITAPSGGGVNQAVTVVPGTQTMVFSGYLKAGTSSACRFYLNFGATPAGLNVDLAAGTISPWSGVPVASSIDPIPGGWWRVAIALTNNGGTVIGPHIFPVGGSGSGSIIATGTMLEPGVTPTPYIPTAGGAQAVRDGHTTLAVGTTPARPLLDAQGRALAPGALVVGTKYTATYDGAAWRLSGAAMTMAQAHALAASFL